MKENLQGKSSDEESTQHWDVGGDVRASVGGLCRSIDHAGLGSISAGWLGAGGVGFFSILGGAGRGWSSSLGWGVGAEANWGWGDIAGVWNRGGVVERSDTSLLADGPGSVLLVITTGRAGSDTIMSSIQSTFIGNWETLASSLAVNVAWTACIDAGESAGIGSVKTSWGGLGGWCRGNGILRAGSGQNGKTNDGGESCSEELHFELIINTRVDYTKNYLGVGKSKSSA